MLLQLSIAWSLIMSGLFLTPAYASCVLATYDACPSDTDPADSRYVDPWNLLIGSPVHATDTSDWIYHWCLKTDPPIDYEFPIDWKDELIDWNQNTICGGYVGVTTVSSFSPSPRRPTAIYVGSNRTLIRPNVRHPLIEEAKVIPDDEHVYSTQALVSLPFKKGTSDLGSMKLTIDSGFSRSESDPKLINYYLEYEDEIADGESFASFMFDPDSVAHVEELKRVFTPADTKRSVEFRTLKPPINLFSTMVFLDGAGEVIGRVPVSLAIPLQE